MLFALFWLVAQFFSPHAFRTFGKWLAWRLRNVKLVAKRTRYIRKNLTLAFPDWEPEQRERVVKENLKQTGAFFLENLYLLLRGHKSFVASGEIRGIDVLNKVAQRDFNVMLLTPHCTALDSCGTLLQLVLPNRRGPDVVYREQKPAVLNYLLYRRRSTYTNSLIKQQATSALVAASRDTSEQRFIWLAPDQDFGATRSVFAPFLGVTHAASLTAPSRVAYRHGLQVLFVESEYDESTKQWILTFREIEGFPTADSQADAATLNEMFGQFIQRCPEQYYWVHRRFKTLPNGELRDYDDLS